MSKGYKIGDKVRFNSNKDNIYTIVKKKDGWYFLKSEDFPYPIAVKYNTLNTDYERIENV